MKVPWRLRLRQPSVAWFDKAILQSSRFRCHAPLVQSCQGNFGAVLEACLDDSKFSDDLRLCECTTPNARRRKRSHNDSPLDGVPCYSCFLELPSIDSGYAIIPTLRAAS